VGKLLQRPVLVAVKVAPFIIQRENISVTENQWYDFGTRTKESEASLDGGGLVLVFADAGLVVANGLSAVGGFMVPEEGIDMNTEEQLDGSISMLDVFDEEGSLVANKSCSILETGDDEKGEDDDKIPLTKK
jgi:hypothetical protein